MKRYKVITFAISFTLFISYIILLLLYGINGDDRETGIMFIVFLCLLIFNIFMVYFLYYRVKRKINLNHLIDLEENIYGHYDKETNHFSTSIRIDSRTYITLNQKDDMILLERFIIIISKFEQRLYSDLESFRQIPYSDPKFFKYAYIYALYYLLEGETRTFTEIMREFNNRINNRSESRILHETFDKITLSKKVYRLPVELLQLMYRFYEQQDSVLDELLSYSPKYKIDEMIYTIILYQYYEETEDFKKQTDIEDQYHYYRKLRYRL